jgi:uncharacterized protein YdeI (YjbR/CyaY-like superfamily)
MEITTTLHVSDREAWRGWLVEHHRTEREVWLVYPRKQTGQPRIPYNDAVEEALCFGWIDSTLKTLDADRLAQRFSPRRPGIPYSQPNRERLRRMLAQGMVAPHVLEKVAGLDLDSFEFPPDILLALQANPAAWRNFQGYSGSYQRIRVAFIDGARSRPEEFERRLRHFVRMTEKNRRFGHDIESFY